MDALPVGALRMMRFALAVCAGWLMPTAHAAEPAAATPLQDDAALHDVQFPGASDGYAVGDHGVVWRTSDGGQTWSFVSTPTIASLRSASFLTPQIGWIAGVEWLPFARLPMGVLQKTVDGGVTWQKVGDGQLPGIEYVRFFDHEEGIVVTQSSPACPSGVWSTGDGGKTWQAIAGPTSPGWRAAKFLAPDLGIVAGAEGRLSLVGEGQLLPARLPSLGDRTIREVTVQGDASGWLVGEGGLVLSTSSGGVSWQTPTGAMPESVPNLFDFHCVEQRGPHVWLAGAPGSIIWHSADAGRTWTSHPTGQATPLHRLRFTTPNNGVAVGALGSILITRDGGQSWHAARGGGRRAAVLIVPSRTRRFVPELLAPLSLEQGYRSVVHVPVNTAKVEAFPSRDAAGEILAATVRQLGGNAGDIGRQLAVDLPGLDRQADKLQARWQSQSEGRAAQTFVGSLVRELRMWRPSVVLIEEPATNDVYGDWVRQAVLTAVKQAGDATRELEQVDVGGLATWNVERVCLQLPPGSQGEVTFDLQALLPHPGSSAQMLASPLRSLWEPALLPRDSLALRCVYPAGQPGSGDLFAGLNLSPGSAARRAFGAIDEKNLDATLKRLQRTRNLVAIAEQAERGSPMSAQLIAQWPQIARDWPAEQGAALLAEAAQRFRRAQEFEHAEAVYLDLVRRYPEQPASLDGLRWLLQYWTSAEIAWQRQKSRGAMQQQWTSDLAGTVDRVEQAAATGSGFAVAPRTPAEVMLAGGPQALDRSFANRRPVSNVTPPDSIDTWRKRAADLAQQLEDQSPALFQQPEIQFPLAALKRNRGSAGNADAVYRRFQMASPDDAARQLVERELWLGAGTPQVPPKLISCRFTNSRPYLDGVLSDPCWEQAQVVPLGTSGSVERDESASPAKARPGGRTSPPHAAAVEATQGLVMFAYDAEFLYVAASIPRNPDASRDPPQLHERSHDADLSQHDWLGIALDIDRDYATWYELRVDQRGWTSDRCWEDVDWDPKWYVAAEGEDARWRIEAAIPWSELSPRAPQPREAWAVSLVRVVPALAEYGWEGAAHWPPRWGDFGLLRFQPRDR